jgi:hypothetical protein
MWVGSERWAGEGVDGTNVRTHHGGFLGRFRGVAGASREWNHRRRRPLALLVSAETRRDRNTRPRRQVAGVLGNRHRRSIFSDPGTAPESHPMRSRACVTHAVSDGVSSWPSARSARRARALARPSERGHPATRETRRVGVAVVARRACSRRRSGRPRLEPLCDFPHPHSWRAVLHRTRPPWGARRRSKTS